VCVRGDGGGGARGAEAGGVLGDGVGGGSRTLIVTFLACRRVDLIRASIESILASRIQESTTFIRA
jgi:hypothetical protein